MKNKIIIILLCATLWFVYQAIQHTESTAGANMEDDNQNLETATYARPADKILRKTLTPLQYRVTRNDATEPPFDNTYWNNKAEGIYVDIVSGEPLFSSGDKFDSGTGWPSFNRPIEAENIVENKDTQFFTVRTEVRSRHGDSHLGHLFDDGPAPTGMRYCINSASLRFVPKGEMVSQGYGDYLKLFKDN